MEQHNLSLESLEAVPKIKIWAQVVYFGEDSGAPWCGYRKGYKEATRGWAAEKVTQALWGIVGGNGQPTSEECHQNGDKLRVVILPGLFLFLTVMLGPGAKAESHQGW